MKKLEFTELLKRKRALKGLKFSLVMDCLGKLASAWQIAPDLIRIHNQNFILRNIS